MYLASERASKPDQKALFSNRMVEIAKMGILEQLGTLVKKQPRSIRNITAFLLTFGLEKVINDEKIFVCPAKGNTSHGLMFIFAPAVILAVLAVMSSDAFWREFDFRFWNVIYNAVVAAALWLFWAFFQGGYYVCAKVGNKEEQLKGVKNQTKIDDINEKFINAKAESEIIGLSIMLVAGVVPVLAITVWTRCFGKTTCITEDDSEAPKS